MKTQVGWMYLIIFCMKFVTNFDNMVISGDFNLPDILWDSINSASVVNELAFIETLHDHLLIQLNKKRTCGNNILDFVIIMSVSNRVNVTGFPLDDGKQVEMIYMDMSKAFDNVNHGCLLQKLHEFGFGGSVLQWFSSYLMGRY